MQPQHRNHLPLLDRAPLNLLAARARPDWAVEQGIVPRDYARLVEQRASEDPRVRAPALERLAVLLYLLGSYDAQIALDRESIALRPRALEPRRGVAAAVGPVGRGAGRDASWLGSDASGRGSEGHHSRRHHSRRDERCGLRDTAVCCCFPK